MAQQYIAVEGLIGVGKTSLCRLLERTWNARLFLEPAETNPFLESFYADPARFAFPVQMQYLIMRWRQQDLIRQGELFDRYVVSDYIFQKDRLFAEKTLPPLELELYDRFAAALNASATRPDLIVWLHAPIEVVLKRIAERRAPGETAIQPEYLIDLNERYERLFSEWKACPILRIDNRDMDYVRDPGASAAILHRIRAALAGSDEPPSLGSESSDRQDAQPELFGGRRSP